MKDRLRKLYFMLGDLFRIILGRERVTVRSRYYGKVFSNIFNCESHVETIRTALGIWSGQLPDLRTEETKRLAREMMEGVV